MKKSNDFETMDVETQPPIQQKRTNINNQLKHQMAEKQQNVVEQQNKEQTKQQAAKKQHMTSPQQRAKEQFNKQQIAMQQQAAMQQQPTKQQQNQQKVLTEKPPLIVINKVNVKTLSESIYNTINNKNFTFNQKKSENTYLQISAMSDYKLILQLLDNMKLAYYTFTPKTEKPVSLVLKNYPAYYTEEDLLQALSDLPMAATVLKAIKLKTSWLIQFSSSAEVAEIMKIKIINQNRISFEKYKGSTVIQCRNCQRFNHVASNCKMPYRCVKCGGSHGPGKCKIPPKDENNEIIVKILPDGTTTQQKGHSVYCVNCQQHGHTASYKSCEVFLKHQAAKQKQTRTAENTVLHRTTKKPNTPILFEKVIPEKSFAAALRSNKLIHPSPLRPLLNTKKATPKTTTTTTTSELTNDINAECHEAFGQNFTKIIMKMNAFFESYDKAAPKIEKQEKLFNLFVNVCSPDV